MCHFLSLFLLFLISLTHVAFSQISNTAYPTDWEKIKSLDKMAIGKLPLDSPILQQAYAEVFIMTPESPKDIPAWYSATLWDLQRRGNSATPLLLKMFADYPLAQFRDELLRKIVDFPTFDTDPFLVAARDYWRIHRFKTPPRTCYAMAELFSRKGNADDGKILLEMKAHPSKEVGFVVQPDIEQLERRLIAGREQSGKMNEAVTTSHHRVEEQTNDIVSTSGHFVQKLTVSTTKNRWLIWSVIISAFAVVLLWIKSRK